MNMKSFVFCCVIFILSASMVSGAGTIASVSVNSYPLSEVLNFSVDPAFTSQNTIIDFTITLRNIGNQPINATPRINITGSGGGLVASLVLTPIEIAVGDDATFISSWNTGSNQVGIYTADMIVGYEGKTTDVVQTSFTIQAVTPPPSGGSGSTTPPVTSAPGTPAAETPESVTPPAELLPVLPPLLPPVEQPLGEGRIRFVKYPIIEETRPGETTTADIVVSNIGEAEITPVDVIVSGVPNEWVEVMSDTAGLGPGDTRSINMGFSIPAGAFPGNYRVTTTLTSGESEAMTFFILRVKPYPAELERPSVTRRVVVDSEKGVSIVGLKVENAGRFIQRLDIVEEIPKDVASHVNQVDFGVPPTEIIEADPVVRWQMDDIDFFETRTLSYEVSGAFEEYSTFVDWPLRQMNILYDISPPEEIVEISRVQALTLLPGDTGNLSITLFNRAIVPISTGLVVDPPTGWRIDPANLSMVLGPESESTLNFTVTAPVRATLGVYTATFRLVYNDREAVKDVSLFVGAPSSDEFPLVIFVLGAVLVLTFIGIYSLGRRIYKGRRKKTVYREDVVSTVQRIKDEMMKGGK
ncbi:NPCBM-associated, NEW3 domain of alpha-galactosidase [archaeon BMS3Abin16]|nr:NPCBM-associated, NEW3 domain of alpha-galactosidase [archaeon BMS3Abin16]